MSSAGLVKLNVWDQISIPRYAKVCLCFPRDSKAATEREIWLHLRLALSRVAKRQPILGRNIIQDPKTGRVWLEGQRNGQEILLEERPLRTLGSDFPPTYLALERSGFAQSAFISRTNRRGWDNLPRHELRKLCRVEVTFLPDGLLLWVYVNTAIADAKGVRQVIRWISAATRNDCRALGEPLIPTPRAQSSKDVDNDIVLDDVETICPEWVLSSGRSNPQDVAGPKSSISWKFPEAIPRDPNQGAIFVFKISTLNSIVESLKESADLEGFGPTAWSVLAALSWAYIPRARLRQEVLPTTNAQSNQNPLAGLPVRSTLMVPINWGIRGTRENTEGFFGSTTAQMIHRIPLLELLALVPERDPETASGSEKQRILAACKWLPRLIRLIQADRRLVNEHWVSNRAALHQATTEQGKRKRLNWNADCPTDLAFHSWRYLASNSGWNIPGTMERGVQDYSKGFMTEPDAMRHVEAGYARASALILPTRQDANELELYVNIGARAREALLEEKGFMQWVERVRA